MLATILGTSLLFLISFGLSFLQIDIAAVIASVAALNYGFFPGIFAGIGSKLLSAILRGKFDHRTTIHIIGILIISIIATLLPFNHYLYPMLLFLIYTIITFPIIQFLGGNLFKGLLFTVKDFVASLILLNLLALMLNFT